MQCIHKEKKLEKGCKLRPTYMYAHVLLIPYTCTVYVHTDNVPLDIELLLYILVYSKEFTDLTLPGKVVLSTGTYYMYTSIQWNL